MVRKTITEKNYFNKIEGTGKFLYSQYRNKEENIEGTEDYFFTDEFSLKACSLEPYLTVYVYFGCVTLANYRNIEAISVDQFL